MPKVFEYQCAKCKAVTEEWFGDTETPPSKLEEGCRVALGPVGAGLPVSGVNLCGGEKEKIQFSRNPSRWQEYQGG